MSSPLHLALPASLQRFDRFSDFPFELRLQVWEDIIYTPGIHFLKFERRNELAHDNSGYRAESRAESGSHTNRRPSTPNGQDIKRPRYTSVLEPVFPFPAADKSYYLTMNKTFTQLSLTCNEAKTMVDKLISRPGNLTLNSGRLVLLERSSDIVCFDYPGATWSRSLGHWASQVDLEQLAKVRRVAIRYSTKWDEDCRICRTCGVMHDFHRDHSSMRPRHVFEFAALFKNLESFYFMDCLAIRKQRDKSVPSQCIEAQQDYGDQGERFASGEGGRTYYEVDPQLCKVNTHVFRTLAWVRDNYITYCKKTSKGPADPESVKFRVLTCEWDTEELVPAKRQEPKSNRSSHKRQGSRIASLTKGMRKLSLGAAPAVDSNLYDGLPVVFGDGGRSSFDFTFQVSPSALRT
ncbi:hypothetical protein F4821DRAFT_225505 [Hypoxylon rubiginosum]|uniref:Uncharacterized protein n=1 Tax=Hypoxylon rubiginosum TaxID=110542 RepID=A0ACC0DFV7_9PEZI|nr:hypothetical protein F4821DRAFT_225505 [Hypoxylon rubiginosum]